MSVIGTSILKAFAGQEYKYTKARLEYTWTSEAARTTLLALNSSQPREVK